MLYQLANKNGIEVGLIDYGARIIRLLVPDRNGKLDDICLGYSDLDEYASDSFFFGCTVGRFANRIRQGRFAVDGKSYQLASNDGVHCLHGGVKGFDKQIWQVREAAASSLRFSRLSPAGEEGFPGNLDVTVSFELTDADELIISYEAATDEPTPVNLTNHTYFNLGGQDSANILQHEMKIHAEYYTLADAELIPTGQLADLRNNALDFLTWHEIGARFNELDNLPRGYDHNYVLSKGGDKLACDLAAEVYEPESGRYLAVYTDQPGMQFYSGNFLNDAICGKNKKPCCQYGGFCLETQNFPDSPNQPGFPDPVLRPGQIYKTKTIYKFGLEKAQRM
jgi:aldose 1-epimerase